MIFFVVDIIVLDAADCDGYYSHPAGKLSSPNYPNPYPSLSRCRYRISIPGSTHITINFQDFETEESNDYLYYGSGDQEPSEGLAIGSFTGDMVTRSLMIPSGSVWFLFTSDMTGNDVGFTLTWDSITTGWFINIVLISSTICLYSTTTLQNL